MNLLKLIFVGVASSALVLGAYETFRDADLKVRQTFDMGDSQMAIISEDRIFFPHYYAVSFINWASATNGMDITRENKMFKNIQMPFSGRDKKGNRIDIWSSGYRIEESK